MTPEELDDARENEVWTRAKAKYPSEPHKAVHEAFEIYRELVRSNWQPPPKPSPRVMAAHNWIIDSNDIAITSEEKVAIQAFLAGYAAAVKEAEPLVEQVRRVNRQPEWFLSDTDALLTTYLTAIGDETP